LVLILERTLGVGLEPGVGDLHRSLCHCERSVAISLSDEAYIV
jgi:hypothetical protein